MNQPIALTEAQYLDRRHNLERDLAYAEADLGNASLQAEIAEDPSIAADAKFRVAALRGRLESLELARSQSGRLTDAAAAARREEARIGRAREAQEHFATADTRAANIQRLMAKVAVEAALYVQDTQRGLALAHPLTGGARPVSDLLQSVAFSTNPEAAWIAAFIYRLAIKGVAEIDGRTADSALGDKTFQAISRARYGAVIALIESVLAEPVAKAA